jgi:hypothetical protein
MKFNSPTRASSNKPRRSDREAHSSHHYPVFPTIAGKVEVSAPNPFVNGAWSSTDPQVNSA